MVRTGAGPGREWNRSHWRACAASDTSVRSIWSCSRSLLWRSGPLWLALGIAIAAAIRLEDGGSVLYRQARLGRDGRTIVMLKFRTMAEDSERYTGPMWAQPGDSRSTAVGRVLRLFHLDELPQVLNVLRGEMSLTGPRPERPELATRIERECPGFARRFAVRPGIAGSRPGTRARRHFAAEQAALRPRLYRRDGAVAGHPAVRGVRLAGATGAAMAGPAGVQDNDLPRYRRAGAEPQRHRGAKALPGRGRLKTACTAEAGPRRARCARRAWRRRP